MKASRYTQSYYKTISTGSYKSASIILPLIFDLISPKSVIDVGCGTGNWLKVCLDQGISDIQGIDGNHIQTDKLLIAPNYFLAHDLTKPLFINRTYDLVISLEVAEHLPESSASTFIQSLCNLGDIILFSAAIPGQGGVNHLNEQYPLYWIDLFSANGFKVNDSIRESIWLNSEIDTCYRQNILIFLRNGKEINYPKLTDHTRSALPLVHPEHFDKLTITLNAYKNVLRTPAHAAWYFIKSWIRYFRIKKRK